MTPRQVARNLLAALAVLGALYLVWRLRTVVELLVIALVLSIALAPAVRQVQRIPHMRRAPAIVLVYLGLLAAVLGIGAVLVPPVVKEVNQFAHEVPRYVRDIRDSRALREYDRRYRITAKLEAQANKLPGTLEGAAAELESVTVGVFRRIVELIAVLVIAFFLLLDGGRWLRFLIGLLRPRDQARARRLTSEAARAVGGYVAGVLCISLAAGLASFVIMTILGIPFAVPLAVQMAFFALIPLVGSAIGAIAIAIVACFGDFPTTVLLWLALFVAYQQAETHLIGPQIYRRTLQMHPLLAIVAVLVGASLLGILGALLAIPAAALIQLVLRDYWSERAEPAVPEVQDPPPATDTIAT